jgi:type II secretory pathway predicted ATPase ExeA
MQIETTQFQQLLQKIHVSQSELARFSGVSPATVSLAVKHGQYPKRHAAMLRAQFKTFLSSHLVAPATIAAALGTIDEVKEVEKKAGIKTQTLTPAPLQILQPSTTVKEMDDPMLLQNETLTPAARKHFGLFRNPFSDDINNREDVFLSPDIRLCRELLWDVAKNGGFCAMIGESGSGKSTLREELLERINREGAPVIVIEPYILAMEDNDVKGKTLKSGQIAETIISALDPNASPKRTPHARFKQLHDLLKASYKSGNTHVLIIEEAHSLPIATLKHLKRFRELKDGFARLLGVVLIGQPELKIKLSAHNPEVREVVQRCEIVELEPLDRHLQEYISHKIARVGGKADDIFEPAAFDAIRKKLTRSVRGGKASDAISICYPLVVNNLVARAMNIAASISAEKISAELILEAV